jgi:hypothetical protein
LLALPKMKNIKAQKEKLDKNLSPNNYNKKELTPEEIIKKFDNLIDYIIFKINTCRDVIKNSISNKEEYTNTFDCEVKELLKVQKIDELLSKINDEQTGEENLSKFLKAIFHHMNIIVYRIILKNIIFLCNLIIYL